MVNDSFIGANKNVSVDRREEKKWTIACNYIVGINYYVHAGMITDSKISIDSCVVIENHSTS